MGYTTKFKGQINLVPPLNAQEVVFLNKFSQSRRMDRKEGPYYVEGDDDRSLNVIDYNNPPTGQPGLWCDWVPTEDGAAIEWSGGEKFYNSVEWMIYLIDHFLKPAAISHPQFGFMQDHQCNGLIKAQGEFLDDRWLLRVIENVVTREELQ